MRGREFRGSNPLLNTTVCNGEVPNTLINFRSETVKWLGWIFHKNRDAKNAERIRLRNVTQLLSFVVTYIYRGTEHKRNPSIPRMHLQYSKNVSEMTLDMSIGHGMKKSYPA